VLFAKPLPVGAGDSHYSECLNDMDEDLINVYRAAADPWKRAQLVRDLQSMPYARKATSQPVLAAARRILQHETAYANKRSSGEELGYTAAGKGGSSARGWLNTRRNLWEKVRRLDAVHLEARDALGIIESWDRPWTFFYVDPPYPGRYHNYVKTYTWDEYHALIDLIGRSQGSFILSGPFTDRIPKDWAVIADTRGRKDSSKPGNRSEDVSWLVDRADSIPSEEKAIIMKPAFSEAFPWWKERFALWDKSVIEMNFG
jgi:site-specific DNA-adenine methylase